MLKLSELAGADIEIPVSYAFSNDFRTTVEGIVGMQTKESKKFICIPTLRTAQIDQEGHLRPDNTVRDPQTLNVLAEVMHNRMSDTLIFIIAAKELLVEDIKKCTTILKSFYDKAHQYIETNQSDRSNLVSSTEEATRAMGIQKAVVKSDIIPPRIVFISNSSEMPEQLAGMAYDLGCIDELSSRGRDPVHSGLNASECEYVDQILGTLKPRGHQKTKMVSSIRKSIFAGNNVVQDIEFAESPENIGGYEKAKKYMEMLGKYVKRETSPVLKIKGSLFIGSAGTGKSRLLTAVPQILGIPGFQLDVNAALGQFQGQSEAKLKDAIVRAKKLAPCILCIDEIEKMLAGTGEGEVAGNEVAAKLLGIILTAMAEPNNIYWVASANKVSHLPAPLLRKGRFDHIWYVPFPSPVIRAKIFGIHCRLNEISVDDLDINKLVVMTSGFTGAEIEHCIKETAIQMIANGNVKASTNEVAAQIDMVKPVSKMKEKEVKELEEWAIINALTVDS